MIASPSSSTAMMKVSRNWPSGIIGLMSGDAVTVWLKPDTTSDGDPYVVSGFSRTGNAFFAPSAVSSSSSSVDIKPMIPLGQFRDTFIIAVDDEGVSIIDQHVAHERVLFERVMERLSSGRLESQQLLLPMVMDLTASAQQALVNRSAELDRLGFEVEPFGAATIKVTAVPALLNIEDCSKALLALAEDLEGLDRGA